MNVAIILKLFLFIQVAQSIQDHFVINPLQKFTEEKIFKVKSGTCGKILLDSFIPMENGVTLSKGFKPDQMRKTANLVDREMSCAVGFVILHRTRLRRVFHDMMHMTERADKNMVIAVGNNFAKFKANVGPIERRYLFLEEKKGHTIINAFCPNCTQSESWIQIPFYWKTNESIIAENPFDQCCDPLKGKTLIAVYGMYAPVIFRFGSERDSQLVEGMNVDLITELAKAMGFKVWFRYGGPDIVVFGEMLGKVGMVSKSQGHIGLPQGVFAEQHERYVDFSSYTYYDHILFGSRHPIPLDEQDSGVIRPFQLKTWYTLILTLSLISGLCFAVHLAQKWLLGRSSLIESPVFSLDFLLIPFFALTEPNSMPSIERLVSGKLVVLSWTWLGMMMVMFYQCNLRAQLISVEYEKPIDNIRDVLNRGVRVYIPLDFPVFTDSLDSVEGGQDIKRVLALAKKTKGAYYLANTLGHMPKSAVPDVINFGASIVTHEVVTNSPRPFKSHLPEIRVMKVPLYAASMHFVFRKYSPWEFRISRISDRLRDSGIFVKVLYQKWQSTPKKAVLQFGVQKDQIPVALDHLSYAMYFIAFGLTIGMITFFIEIISNFYKWNWNNSK